MLDNIIISEAVIIAIVSSIFALYIACLFAFVSQLKGIRESADVVLIAALEKLCQILNLQPIPTKAAEVYSELVEAHKSYICIKKSTNTILIITSTIGIIFLTVTSLLLLIFSNFLSLMLITVLFPYTLIIIIVWLRSWLKSNVSILRF